MSRAGRPRTTRTVECEITDAMLAIYSPLDPARCYVAQAINAALAGIPGRAGRPPLSATVLDDFVCLDDGRTIVEVPASRQIRRLVERCDCGDPIRARRFLFTFPEPEDRHDVPDREVPAHAGIPARPQVGPRPPGS